MAAADVGAYGVCRPVQRFEKVALLGEGTYGVVYLAVDTDTGQLVALKKMRMDRTREAREGYPITAAREIKILQSVDHPNIVKLSEVVVSRSIDSTYLVFEYCQHDLSAILPRIRDSAEIKTLLYQLLKAVSHLHERFIIHRDIKLANLLYGGGELKLADFGLARYITGPGASGTSYVPDMRRSSNGEHMTPMVVTLWYRAPELLFGLDQYSTAVDMWSVGCVMGELILHRPLMPGESEASQLSAMFKLLGTPSETIWPGFNRLPHARKFDMPQNPRSALKLKFPHLSSAGLDLLNRMLTYDPAKRISAKEAMNHAYFKERPYVLSPHSMPVMDDTRVKMKIPKQHVAAAHRPAHGPDPGEHGHERGKRPRTEHGSAPAHMD